jgi:murein L,D-transpeptidase YafK
MNKLISFIVFASAILGIYFFYVYGRAYWHPVYREVAGTRSVADVVDKYGDSARQRMKPYFKQANLTYPPKSIVLLAIKDQAKLELWDTSKQEPAFVREYPIQALSGVAGPKLREGDRQVPEGIYDIVYLNPNSSYHLSMKLNYPNAFDKKHAKAEGRTEPGTNIFIHGKAVSIGCLAMGDNVAEELFILATDIGYGNIKVAIAPNDPRTETLKPDEELAWTKELYTNLTDYYLRFIKSKD